MELESKEGLFNGVAGVDYSYRITHFDNWLGDSGYLSTLSRVVYWVHPSGY